MDLRLFQSLPTAEVADMVRNSQIDVCGFALNGTRRWFILENQLDCPTLDKTAYFKRISGRLIELCQMIYDHGIQTLVMPIISPYLLTKRGPEYTQMVIQSLGKLTFGDDYLRFYTDYDVRVRFYGDVGGFEDPAVSRKLTRQFEDVTRATAPHNTHRLFWGVCAHSPTQQIAALTVEFFKQFGRVPDEKDLIALYYGEPVNSIDLFISASKPRAFDTPLLSSGREELYFSVAPSPYMNQNAFRKILHDTLFNRSATHPTYQVDHQNQWYQLRDYYRANRENILGVGRQYADWGIWLPTTNIQSPEEINQNNWLEDETA